ncbi:AIPR family protein [Nocardioides sp. Bht2]|uniref:AIPR family protein n=1 Tax=Nocardioides sp. Bht2 TaxID=3392297 RepID=UPI0039B69B8B
MSANDVILLTDMVDRTRLETASLNDSEQETYFVARHYLSAYRPSHDDLLSGIVDGTLDGGIDAIYIFANGYCLRDDTNLSALGRSPQLDLVLIQVKNSKGFGEAAVDKLIVHLPKLLDFTRDDAALAQQFNPRVIEITRRFLDTYRAMDMPELRIFSAFAALKADQIHPNVEAKAAHLRETLTGCFGTCEPLTHLLDAAAMANMARDKPPVTMQLALAENPISTDMAGGYVGLVRLNDYQKFITDDTGKLDAALFEANVRDYEGESGVNRSIQGTLEHEDKDVDFWWLNNGVTIVADKVQPAGKLLQLVSPQIVNGLQTSHEIYKRGRSEGFKEERGVLVKVIQADDDQIKDRIIRATNSQTSLGLSSLRATDRVQREIEEFFRAKGLYYERRKNFYWNRQIPLHKLVSIDQLGQAVMATLVQVPHVSRGEVSRIFQDEVYDVVFASNNPIEMYFPAIQVVRKCELYLRNNRQTQGQVDDFVFHLSMASAVALTRKTQPSAKDIASIELMPSNQLLRELIGAVQEEFARVARTTNQILFDKVAKDPRTTQALRERMTKYLGPSRRR